MRDNYVKLIDFVFGKYMYTVMKNNDKVLYFEVVNNKYVAPVYSFNLYDNEGKSLTSVNEHFFMNQLINRINIACKKGIFVNDQEIVDFLNKINGSCGDPELKKLFKGSYMKEIDEYNFESNKKNILNYLDKFKYDTFVDYNNVAIFDGSLEKNDSVLPTVSTDVSVDESIDVVDDNIADEKNEEVMDVIDVDDMNSSDNQVVQSEIPSSDSNVVQNEITSSDNQAVSEGIDFTNIPVDNSLGDVVNSNDYFSNQTNTQIDNNLDVQNNVDSLSNESIDSVQSVEASNDQSVDIVNDVQNNDIVDNNVVLQQDAPVQQNVDLTAPLDFNSLYVHNDSEPVVQDNVVSQDNIQMVPNAEFSTPVFENDFSSMNTDVSHAFSQEVQPTSELGQDVPLVQNNDVNQSVEFSNDGFSLAEPLVDNSIDFKSSNSGQVSNSDYLNQVKNRIQGNTSDSSGDKLGVLNSNVTEADLDKTVVTDKVDLPDLENVTNDDSVPKKEKKSFGVVIFIIILLILLGVFAYFLYNYVF